MSSSIMCKLEHSFMLKSKHRLLFTQRYSAYYLAMLKNDEEEENLAMLKNDEEEEKLELAARLKVVFDAMPRGFRMRVSEKCDISPTAITGWLKTGRIDKNHLDTVAVMSGYDLHWLITGKGSKKKNQNIAIIADHKSASNGHETRQLHNFLSIPVVGNAQLGDNGYWNDLEYPVGYGDGYINYPTRDQDAYALRCTGDSMKPRIRNGEFVIVEPNRQAKPGDDVVLKSLDGRVMVKTLLYMRDGRVHLLSINEAHPPQSFALNEIDKIHPIAGIATNLLFVKT